METRTQSVDRLLEAAAPALAAELERILHEIREQQEQEFRNRLEVAVREAEEAAMRMAEVHREHAVGEACQAVRVQVTEEMRAHFDEARERAMAELKRQFDAQTETAEAAWAVERARLEDHLKLWRVFADAQRQLAESTSQAEILTRFVNLAEPFADSVAVYVNRPSGFALWKARGPGDFPAVAGVEPPGSDTYFKPLVVRERTVAAVSARAPYKVEPLDFLVGALARAIEAFGLRLGPASAHSGQSTMQART